MAHVLVKKKLYLSVVRSKLLYCSQFWRPHLKSNVELLSISLVITPLTIRTDSYHFRPHSYWETAWILYFVQLLRNCLNYLLCTAFERMFEFFTLCSFWETGWILYFVQLWRDRLNSLLCAAFKKLFEFFTIPFAMQSGRHPEVSTSLKKLVAIKWTKSWRECHSKKSKIEKVTSIATSSYHHFSSFKGWLESSRFLLNDICIMGRVKVIEDISMHIPLKRPSHCTRYAEVRGSKLLLPIYYYHFLRDLIGRIWKIMTFLLMFL